LSERRHDAELAIRTMGIAFTVYGEGEDIDREQLIAAATTGS